MRWRETSRVGKLVFEHERFYQRILHNETGHQLQRRLQFKGMNAMVLPVRVMEHGEAPRPVAGALREAVQ